MTCAYELSKHTATTKIQIRKLESIKYKILRCKWSTIFNKICLKENLLPDYTRMRYHDPALQSSRDTLNYRKSLVNRELELKEDIFLSLKSEENHQLQIVNNNNIDCVAVLSELDVMLSNSETVQKSRTLKKLNDLYNGHILIKEDVNCYLNLSSHELSENEKQFLNLGLNFHLQSRYDKMHKKTELEILYDNLLKLQDKNKINISPGLQEQLAAEGTKHRHGYHHSVLTPQLKDAANQLRSNDDIIIRRADKSSIYVILDKNEYFNKLNNILSDSSKFKMIQKDPTSSLKTKLNKIIEALNSVQGDLKLSKIVGEFAPGYIYGNIKIHKDNNPLRPIISQCPTITYNLAKTINKIISPFMPNTYSIKSSTEFIDILHSTNSTGIIASLDVESLFTNVPIDPTIDIIIQHVYHHPTMTAPKIPPNILRELLSICTKESPFRSPAGGLYLQIEGVAMGSPLGPTFAGFYMGHLEDQTFNNRCNKPNIYVRYVDDIFMQVNDIDQLLNIKEIFQQNSVLNFTYELHNNNRLPFLDISVKIENNRFITSVHHKPTDYGQCLNANSECPDKYKRSVIVNYINRAYKYSQNWETFHNEIQRVKQVLINNNYSNSLVDYEINKFLEKQFSPCNQQQRNNIPIYYHNQMHTNYKLDERVLKEIVYNNTNCINPNDKLNLVIYYKNKTTSNLIIKNNISPPLPPMQQSRLIYEFSCPLSHPNVISYIGYTQNNLNTRLNSHVQHGSIKEHFMKDHKLKLTKTHLIDNTVILAKANDKYRLTIKEALFISQKQPYINKQFDNFSHTLKLFKNKCNSASSSLQQAATVSPRQPMARHDNPPPHSTPINNSNSSQLNNATLQYNSTILNHTTPVRNVSPNISNRINMLYRTRYSQFSPPNLRPRNSNDQSDR